MRMKKNSGHTSHERHAMDYALVAIEQMELYCQAHPGSPAAVRRPRLFVRGELWIALLGPSVEEGIVGIGRTVTEPLRAFDAQYLAGLRPPAEIIGTVEQREARPLRLSDSMQVAKQIRHNHCHIVTKQVNRKRVQKEGEH